MNVATIPPGGTYASVNNGTQYFLSALEFFGTLDNRIAIWAATGMGYFWPMWPILGWGIGVFSDYRSPARSGRCGAVRHRPSSPQLPRA